MKRLLSLVLITLAMMLTACGGGGGNPGTNLSNPVAGGGTTIPTSTATVVTDFQLGFNKNTLNNNGADEVVLNVVAVDQNNNVARGQAVQVSVDSQAIFNAAGTLTDADGRFTGKITSPTNKNDRVITVTAKIGTIIKTATLNVVGSAITVTPLPAAPIAGAAVSYNISLKDSGGIGIPGVPLNVGGTVGLTGTLNTDINGNVTIGGAAPATVGTYTVVISGSGVTTTRSILVVSASGSSSIANATTITLASLNADKTNIKPNLSNSSINRAVMSFRMFDANFQAVPNIRVRFSIQGFGLGAGETMSTGSTVVYTDANGLAQSDYISGQRSSATNGVQVRACYGQTDADLAGGACPRFVDAFLTVAGTPLNLSIFSNNVIEPVGVGNILYKKTYVVQIADSAGAPVQGAVVSASVDITHYGKGGFNGNYTRSALAPVISDNTITGTLNAYTDVRGNLAIADTPGIYTIAASNPLGSVTVSFRVWCANEDKNRNGVSDAGENIDGDNVLEPRASDVVVLAVGSNVSDASGNVTLVAQWGQNIGSWIAFTLKATTNVGGSEGTNSAAFVTGYLESDEPNGAFRIPPYGINRCDVNN